MPLFTLFQDIQVIVWIQKAEFEIFWNSEQMKAGSNSDFVKNPFYIFAILLPTVSYTHLDVYKRQEWRHYQKARILTLRLYPGFLKTGQIPTNSTGSFPFWIVYKKMANISFDKMI